MKLSAITDELRKMASGPDKAKLTAVLGGTTYTIYAGQTAQTMKFRPFKPETPLRLEHDIARDKRIALALYGGTERKALDTLRAQVEKLGDDMDPAARKRAMLLIAEFERGHIIHKDYPYAIEYSKRGKRTYVYDTSVEPTLRINRDDQHVLNAALGREWGHTITPEQLAKLSETFIIHTL